MFTPEELAEIAAADAEIEAEFRLTQEDLDRSRELDREAKFRALPMEKQKVAAQRKAYREANREKVAAQRKATGKPTGSNCGNEPGIICGNTGQKKRAAAGAVTPTTAKK